MLSFVKVISLLVVTWLSSLPGVAKQWAEGGVCSYAEAEAGDQSKDSDKEGGTEISSTNV